MSMVRGDDDVGRGRFGNQQNLMGGGWDGRRRQTTNTYRYLELVKGFSVTRYRHVDSVL